MILEHQPSPAMHERFRGDHPIVVEGLVNRFGDFTVHEDLSPTVDRG